MKTKKEYQKEYRKKNQDKIIVYREKYRRKNKIKNFKQFDENEEAIKNYELSS